MKELMDRAKLAYLGQLMGEEGSVMSAVAKRLGCSDANVRKMVIYLERKYGDTRGEGESGADESAEQAELDL
ncbi:MAG: hypothetical protein ACK5MY_02600 [Jhaorihella sp.]